MKKEDSRSPPFVIRDLAIWLLFGRETANDPTLAI